MDKSQLLILRRQVSREAALLLYSSQEKEYKQAKKRAAKTLGARILPSNLEVAKELDKIAEEIEGSSRQERLLRMRNAALQIMGALKNFQPRLVGSVWRGTANKNSDIDIVAFSSDPTIVLEQLQKIFRVLRSEWRSVTKRGRKQSSFHIHIILPSKDEAEVVVRSCENMGQFERCEIYGDSVIGLKYSQLQRTLKENPLQKFLPSFF